MNFRRKVFSTIALIIVFGAQANAAAVKVIANPSVAATSISADDLQQVFLQNKDSLGGSHVLLVLEKQGAAHEAFLKYLGKSDASLQAYYRSLVFTGKGAMPKVLASDDEVIAYVAKTKGAVGYVSPGSSTEGVKVLEIK